MAEPEPEPVRFELHRDVARAVLAATNEYRLAGGTCAGERMPAVRAVAWEHRLAGAAERHVRDLAEHDEFGHTGTDGSSPGDRARDAGYHGPVGENLTTGSGRDVRFKARTLVDGWVRSPPHCRNLFDGRWRWLGVSVLSVHGDDVGRLWWDFAVQVFGG